MSNIPNQVAEINHQAFYRSREISLMFSQLSSFNCENNNVLEKYFLARSVVVFSYGTIEKFVKTLTHIALTAILDNQYFPNNTKDLLCVIKAQKDTPNLFNILMHYKYNSGNDHTFEYSKDKSYFSNLGRVNSFIIAHICDVLNLNKTEPLLKIPKLTLDTLYKNRTTLAHGDYIVDLKKFFNPSKCSITINDIDDYIYDNFKLTDNTKDELLNFINDFKNKIILLLNEIEEYKKFSSCG
ncbi:hypothetical protein [Clostridium culturomicium]|uniref:hypothetical protein n=1 Tax=Clostridium culturomicium TaxID=1499683 RepID=UPI0038576562